MPQVYAPILADFGFNPSTLGPLSTTLLVTAVSHDGLYTNLDVPAVGVTVFATPGRRFVGANISSLSAEAEACFPASSEWALCFPPSAGAALQGAAIELQLDEILAQNLTLLPEGLEPFEIMSSILNVEDAVGNIDDGTVNATDIGMHAWLNVTAGAIETLATPPFHILYAPDANSPVWEKVEDFQVDASRAQFGAVGTRVANLGAFLLVYAPPTYTPVIQALSNASAAGGSSQAAPSGVIFYEGEKELKPILRNFTVYRSEDVLGNGKLDSSAANETWKEERVIKSAVVVIVSGFSDLEDVLTLHPEIFLNGTNATSTSSIRNIYALGLDVENITHGGIHAAYNATKGELRIEKSDGSLLTTKEAEDTVRRVVYGNYENNPERQQKKFQ
ncbi:unnamed protein product, partial [Ostreobium quekettii]